MPATCSLLVTPRKLGGQQHLERARRADSGGMSALWHTEQCYDSFVYTQLSLSSTDHVRDGSAVAGRHNLMDYLREPYYRQILAASGFAAEAEEIERHVAAGDVKAAAAAISDEALDEIGLGGTPSEVEEPIRGLRRSGVDEAVMYANPAGYGDDPADWLEMYFRFIDTLGQRITA